MGKKVPFAVQAASIHYHRQGKEKPAAVLALGERARGREKFFLNVSESFGGVPVFYWKEEGGEGRMRAYWRDRPSSKKMSYFPRGRKKQREVRKRGKEKGEMTTASLDDLEDNAFRIAITKRRAPRPLPISKKEGRPQLKKPEQGRERIKDRPRLPQDAIYF